MINKIKKYNIVLNEKQEKIIIDYFSKLEKLFKEQKIDLESYYDLQDNIIEKLISKKDNITEKYIENILKELWTPEEIIEPYISEKLSLLDELKQIFPLSWDKKILFKHYWILLLKIIWWIWIWLWILGIIKWFILVFVNISIFNIDITSSIPLFLKILTFLISILVIFLSSYLINFKKSKLRNYTTWLLVIVVIIISIFWWYNLATQYNNLNTFSANSKIDLNNQTNYELWDINLFWPLEWNMLYTIITKELTKEYINENKNFINIIPWNELKIDITRNILWNENDANLFNKNISDLKIKIIDNKIYIFRSWYYFKNNTKLIPFLPKIKIEIPKNVKINTFLRKDK